jgi:deazaflavin-dependent oxidoreductase (nitroreductase family)
MRYVDPHRRRGSAYRLYTRLLNTPLANWLSRNVVWKLDPLLMRISGGRIGFGVGLPTALLETRGARSGRLRRNGVIYFNDGDDVIVIASKLGLPDHPTWFHNLCAHPDVVLGGDPFRAEVVADDAERTRLWALADNVFPPYAAYRARTQRTIPIVRLVPR